MFPEGFPLFLACTQADAQHFDLEQKIQAKFFGRTSTHQEHITLTQDVGAAIIETMTVANANTMDAVHNSSRWMILEIEFAADDFGNFVRSGVLEFWNKKKGAWRWWGDIDLTKMTYSWCTTETEFPLDLDTWAAKMLSQYKRMSGESLLQKCDGCDNVTNVCWRGTHDFSNTAFCVRCWFNYLMERNGKSSGRVESFHNQKKRKLEIDASTDDQTAKAAPPTIKLDCSTKKIKP